ncbi:MAG: 23S rRNA (adenine(2030)-N(6))-methyltransferase RlmJ [Pseudomonadota bacterium]
MNYRHVYHAGNFADVVKHIILTRVIAYMQRKEAGFMMLDTHAGIGRYDLASEQAQKTGEADMGIKRYFALEMPSDDHLDSLLSAYDNIVKALNAGGKVTVAPGSPEILSRMRRPQDRCVFNELHPADSETLEANYQREKKTEVTRINAWTVLRAKLPPHERRGLILIDPPFEKKSETDDLLNGLSQAIKRFSTGTYLIWYPLKDDAMGNKLRDGIKTMEASSALDTKLQIKASKDGSFYGSGMVILNPPYTLFDELQLLLAALADSLGGSANRDNWATDWLIAPK